MGQGGANKELRPQTRLVRGGQVRSAFEETAEALYLTSGYVYESPELAEAAFKGDIDRYVYSRYANPTISMFEERLRLLEGAESCRATASGMSAVFASMMCQVRAGDRVVSSRALFGSCQFILAELLPRWGVETVFVDGTDLDQWREALSRPTTCVFLETPSNPALEIIDIAAVAEMAHAAGAKLIVDNVFASPVLQRPMEFGADLVVYSATKYFDGQGRVLGGAVLGQQALLDDNLVPLLRHTGPSLSPFNAWVLVKGMETLQLRVERHCANALEIAKFLRDQPVVRRVIYPHLDDHPQYHLACRQMSAGGSIVTLDFAGERKQAFDFLRALRIFDISNNLGDAKSLATHPATTTHQRLSLTERAAMGITEGMVRLSIGLEDVEDLKDDLDQAVAATLTSRIRSA